MTAIGSDNKFGNVNTQEKTSRKIHYAGLEHHLPDVDGPAFRARKSRVAGRSCETSASITDNLALEIARD
jgi:hypothetical protein